MNKENDLQFRVSIKGTTSDPSQTDVVMRFVISENDSGTAIMFPLEPRGDGIVGCSMPAVKDFFSESKEYTGKVEVIVAGRYFDPTTVSLGFEKELEVEASPIFNEKAPETQASVILETPKETDTSEVDSVLKGKVQQKSKLNEKIVSNFGQNILHGFFEDPRGQKNHIKQVSTNIRQEENVQKKPTVQQPNSKRDKTKNSLKSLIASAWDDIQEN